MPENQKIMLHYQCLLKVVAARVGDDLFVKRLQQVENNNWLLASDNHQYTPIMLADAAQGSANVAIGATTVIGEIVWQGR